MVVGFRGGDEAAGDIYGSVPRPRRESFGEYDELHRILGKFASATAPRGRNTLLYDEQELGLQAPAVNGSAIGPPEDDLDALELASSSCLFASIGRLLNGSKGLNTLPNSSDFASFPLLQ